MLGKSVANARLRARWVVAFSPPSVRRSTNESWVELPVRLSIVVGATSNGTDWPKSPMKFCRW